MDDSKLIEEVFNFFEDLMYDYGGSPLLGRIYGLCVIESSKSHFQKDLQENFKVNPSTISRNLKELESWNLIIKRREPGSREWQYQLNNTSFLELFLHNFEENKMKLQEKLEELERLKIHWDESYKKNNDFDIINKLIRWIKVVDQELNAFITNLNKKYIELEKELEK